MSDYVVASPEQMWALGEQLAGLLRAGDLVLLAGPLGAGKTVLAQGIARGLGVQEPVTSPTFVIAHVHRDGSLPLVHVDAYRLSSVAELDDLDLDAELADSVTLVEWGHGVAERLADAHLLVRIERGDDDETRTVTVEPHGDAWADRPLPSPVAPDPGT